jgi:DHA1 family bicyclomycin/chloramphenicol resistance-like MFS transporter
VLVLSIACASTMLFVVPRRSLVVSEALIEQAEENEAGVM